MSSSFTSAANLSLVYEKIKIFLQDNKISFEEKALKNTFMVVCHDISPQLRSLTDIKDMNNLLCNAVISHFESQVTALPTRTSKERLILKLGENELEMKNVFSVQLKSMIARPPFCNVNGTNNVVRFRETSMDDSWLKVTIEEGKYVDLPSLMGTIVKRMNELGNRTYTYNYDTRKHTIAIVGYNNDQIPKVCCREPGGQNAAYDKLDLFEIAMDGDICYMLGFENGVTVTGEQIGDNFQIYSPTRVNFDRLLDFAIAQFKEIPKFSVLVPIGHNLHSFTDAAAVIGRSSANDRFLPNLSRLTLQLMDVRGKTFPPSAVLAEVEITTIN